jgi:WD40 repeat protein
MASLFISYSRKDIESARKLTGSFNGQGLDFWIDWEGIPPTVDWWKEIERGIEQADIFLFLLSPDSAASKVCKQEIEHATKNGKRLIPVVVRDMNADDSPAQLRSLNWIFLRQTDDFSENFSKLITAIKTDYEWVQVHRQLQVKALEWEKNNHENGFLLHGEELQEAEIQLVTNSSKEPHPTDLQREYVLRSRQATDKQRRSTISIATAGLIVLAVLAVIAFIQSGIARQAQGNAEANAASAQTAQAQAEEQANIALSRQLAAQALLILPTDLRSSLLLSVEAFHKYDTFEARNALLTTLNHNPDLNGFLQAHTSEVWTLDFSPDGNLLASGSNDNTILLWSIETHEPIGQPLIGHTGKVREVKFSPNGKILASTSDDGTIRLWDVETHQLIDRPLIGNTASADHLAFSPDGITLASISGGMIDFWDLSNPASPYVKNTFTIPDGDMVEFSPDWKTVVSSTWEGKSVSIHLWNFSNLASITEVGPILTVQTNQIFSLAFSPDSRLLATGCAEGTIILWDVSDPTSAHQLSPPMTGQTNYVWSMAFSPNGKILASASEDHTVRLWDLTNPASPTMQKGALTDHKNRVLAVAFSLDGKTLASSDGDAVIILWNIENPGSVFQIGKTLEMTGDIKSIVFSPDQNILALSGYPGDVITLLETKDLTAPNPLGSINVEPGCRGDTLIALNPYKKILVSASCSQRVLSGDPIPEIISGQDQIALWDMADPASPRLLGKRFNVPYVASSNLILSPDGNILATCCGDDKVDLWDIRNPASPQQLGQLSAETENQFISIAFSPNGKILATGQRQGIDLWDMSNPRSPQKLSSLTSPYSGFGVTFSSDGKTLVSEAGTFHAILLWDVSIPASLHQLGIPLTAHRHIVESLDFSPDGRMLASSSNDDTVILWDVSNLKAPRQLGVPITGSPFGVAIATFSPDGKILIFGGPSDLGFDNPPKSQIFLWDVNPESWIQKACRRAGRNFTQTEWTQYFPDEPYRQTCHQPSTVQAKESSTTADTHVVLTPTPPFAPISTSNPAVLPTLTPVPIVVSQPSEPTDLSSLLGKKTIGPEVDKFRDVYTNGPCLEVLLGSRILSCESKTGETPFIELKVSDERSLVDSTIEGVWMYPSYMGNLPEGLTWGLSEVEIEKKLGPPIDTIDNGDTTLDVEYKTTNNFYRLWITYDANTNMKTIYIKLSK